jgi:hypothetical protein
MQWSISHVLLQFSSFKQVISAKAEANASAFPTAAEATSSDFLLNSLSSSEILPRRERSSFSSDCFNFSDWWMLEKHHF